MTNFVTNNHINRPSDVNSREVSGVYVYRYDPVITGLFVAVAALLLWYFSALAIDEKIVPVGAGFVLSLISTLCGTSAGAFMAYFFARRIESERRRHEQRIIENERLIKSNSILIELGLMKNDIANANLDYSKTSTRFKSPQYDGYEITIGMICDGQLELTKGVLPQLISKNPNLIMRVSLISSQYRACINAINERNRFALDVAEPVIKEWRMTKASADGEDSFHGEYAELREVLKQVMEDEQKLIDQVRNNIKQFSNDIDSVIQELYEELSVEMPKQVSDLYKL